MSSTNGGVTYVDFDRLFLQIGQFGPYQRKIAILLGFPIILVAAQLISWVITSPKVSHRCMLPFEVSLPQNDLNYSLPTEVLNKYYPRDQSTGEYSQCRVYNDDGHEVYCDRYVYDTSEYSSSVLMTWDLVCHDTWISGLTISLFMAGNAIGSVAYGFISDIIGRKKTIYLACAMQLIVATASALTPNLISFIVLRFLVGTCCQGIFITCYCLAIEIVGPNKRIAVNTYLMICFATGSILDPLLGVLLQDWRMLLLTLSLTGALFLSYWWLIPESPRWLILNSRMSEAETILRTISQSNGKKLPKNWAESQPESSDQMRNGDTQKQQSVFVLCKYPQLRWRTLDIWFNWFVICTVYYGLSLNTSNLGGNLYVNATISGVVEIPANIMTFLLLDRVGRKWPLCVSLLTSGVCLLITAAFPINWTWPRIALSMLGKLAISGAFGIVFIFTAELFPTFVRTIGLGSAAMSAKVGGIVAPNINLIADIWLPGPLLVFGILSVTSGLLALYLPETLNTKLPETLEDVKCAER